MSDLFEEDSVEEVVELVEEFDGVEVSEEPKIVLNSGLDARRRLENILEEKRLRDELDDFENY